MSDRCEHGAGPRSPYHFYDDELVQCSNDADGILEQENSHVYLCVACAGLATESRHWSFLPGREPRHGFLVTLKPGFDVTESFMTLPHVCTLEVVEPLTFRCTTTDPDHMARWLDDDDDVVRWERYDL